MHLHHPPPSRACPGESDDPHIHQLVSWTLAFTRTWFPDGSKSSRGGGSERTTSNRLKIRLTSSRMSGVFIFSCRLVIWTFDINYLRSSHSRCLRLEMLFNVWWEDLRKAVIADSTQDTLVCTASTQGRALHSVFLPRCPGTSLAFILTLSEWMSPPCPGWGEGGGSSDWYIRKQEFVVVVVCLFVCLLWNWAQWWFESFFCLCSSLLVVF